MIGKEKTRVRTVALFGLMAVLATGVGAMCPPRAEAQISISLDARQPLTVLGAMGFQILDASSGGMVFPSLDARLVHDLTIAAGIYRLVPSAGPTTVVFRIDPPPPGCLVGPFDPCCGTVTLTSAPSGDTTPPTAPTNLRVQ